MTRKEELRGVRARVELGDEKDERELLRVRSWFV
jgi:hypothetical protein